MSDFSFRLSFFIILFFLIVVMPYLIYLFLNKIFCRFNKLTAFIVISLGVLLMVGDLYGLYYSLYYLSIPDITSLPNSHGWRGRHYSGTHEEAIKFLLFGCIPLAIFAIVIIKYGKKLFCEKRSI